MEKVEPRLNKPPKIDLGDMTGVWNVQGTPSELP